MLNKLHEICMEVWESVLAKRMDTVSLQPTTQERLPTSVPKLEDHCIGLICWQDPIEHAVDRMQKLA